MTIQVRCYKTANNAHTAVASIAPGYTGWTAVAPYADTAPVVGDLIVVVGLFTLTSGNVTQSAGTGSYTFLTANGDPNASTNPYTSWCAYRQYTSGDTGPTFAWSGTTTAYCYLIFALTSSGAGGSVSFDASGTPKVDTSSTTAHTPNTASASTALDAAIVLNAARYQTSGSHAISMTTPCVGYSAIHIAGYAGATGFFANSCSAYMDTPVGAGTITPGAETFNESLTNNAYTLLAKEFIPVPPYAGGPQGWSSPAGIRAAYVRTGLAMASQIPLPASSSPSILTTSLPGGIVSRPYAATLSATGGTPAYTWSISAGSLPAGLTLNSSTGVISGTPTGPPGTTSFTVEVTDSLSNTATKPLSITIIATPVTWSAPARGRITPPPRGRTWSNPGGPVRNPPVPAPVYPLHGPVQAKRPLPRRGSCRAVSSITIIIPVPSPASFTPKAQPARAVIPQNAPRGRVISGRGAPLRNPQAGPVFRPLQGPVRGRIQPATPRGRVYASPAAVKALPPVTPAPFRQATRAIQARLPQQPLLRGRTRSGLGAPPRNPGVGPAFRQGVHPAAARLPVPLLKGRIGSDPGSFPVNAGTPPFAIRVWPGNPYPTWTQYNAGSYVLGTQFSVSATCYLLKIWWFSPPGVTLLPSTCGIWDVANFTAIAEDNAPAWKDPDGSTAAPGDGWVYCDFSAAQVFIEPGINYVVSAYQYETSTAWWVTVPGYWTEGSGLPGENGITHGLLTAPNAESSVNGQGCYDTSGTWEFPGTNPGNGEVFYVDAELFVPSGPPFYPKLQPVRAPIPQNAPRGRVYSHPGAPVRNPASGPVFRQQAAPARARIIPPRRGRVASNPGGPVQNPVPPVPAPFRPRAFVQPRQPLPRRGTCRTVKFYPVQSNPGTGPAFIQATRPVQARFPLPPRGRISANPGGPVRNPVLGTGPAFYPKTSARAQLPLPRRGACRTIKFSPLQGSPQRGPAFIQATSPARIRPSLPPRGWVGSNPGGPLENPIPPIVAIFFPKAFPARARIPQNSPRGRVYPHPGAPVRNPNAGPVFHQAVHPVQARQPLPPRGRIASNPGGPVRNPAVPAPVYPLHSPVQARFPLPPRGRIGSNPGSLPPPPPVPAKVYPAQGPVRFRITLPPRGRTTGNPGGPVRNPHPGPAFRQSVRPIRGVIPQNAPRGRTSGNPGGPVENIPFATLRFRTGTPYFQWATEDPGFQWDISSPGFEWATGDPEAG